MLKVIDYIKRLFKKGGYALTGKTLRTINDHPKINIDPKELARIEKNLREYRGDYPKVRYTNSNGEPKERQYMHLNIRKMTAEYLASLVFNEQAKIYISDAKEGEEDKNSYKDADELTQHVLEHNKFNENLLEYLEPGFSIGGLTARPYVNERNEIEFSWAISDAFFPLKSDSRGVSEGVMKFTTMQVEGDKMYYYTLLEFHEWVATEEGQDALKITNELYKSESDSEIGKEVPLESLEDYEGVLKESYITGLTRPQFNYLKPAGFNNINPHSPLGLGICDNSQTTMKDINDTYDQFYWEKKMGQRTVFVSDQLLKVISGESGQAPTEIFDPDVNIYKLARFEEDQEPIKDITRDIRTEQYIEAINYSIGQLERELKFSPGTFSFDGKSVKTATEIVSENSLTYQTRNKHAYQVEQFIKGVIISTLELAKSYGLYKGEIPSKEHIGVDLDDGLFQDKPSELRYYGQAKTLGLIPDVEAIKRVWKLPQKIAEEWYQQILESQADVDPMSLMTERERKEFGEEE